MQIAKITQVVVTGLKQKDKLSLTLNKLFGIGYDKNFVAEIKNNVVNRFISNAQQIVQQTLLDVDNKEASSLRHIAAKLLNQKPKKIYSDVPRKYQHDLPLFKALIKGEYICITDIARFKNKDRTGVIIGGWLINRNIIEFMGIWEQLNNSNVKPVEFDGFKKEAGLNSFTLTPKQWIEKTNAIGLVSRAGRYGGTYAQKDITFGVSKLDFCLVCVVHNN